MLKVDVFAFSDIIQEPIERFDRTKLILQVCSHSIGYSVSHVLLFYVS